MMTTCPICGTRRVITWPEHWVYRRGDTCYCSDYHGNLFLIEENPYV